MRFGRRTVTPGDELESRLTWILGSPRSGSTWLLHLLNNHPGIATVDEPLIGTHLAPFAPALLASRSLVLPQLQAQREQYFFSDRHAETWRPLVRELILGRMAVEGGDAQVVAIKEPNGSQAAETILSVLPGSRLFFLLRDGRDVVDSKVAALQPDAWLGRDLDPQVSQTQLAEHFARNWLTRTEAVERAWEKHDPGLRYRLKYEDLLADPATELSGIFEWLELPAGRRLIERAVARHDFSTAPERGPGSFHRAASPGLWRENLTAEQQRVVGELLDAKLVGLGYPPS